MIAEFRVTFVFFLIGAITFFVASSQNINMFESILGYFRALENFEFDEILLLANLVGFGLIFDLVRIREEKGQRLAIQEQKLRVLRASMTAACEIVNNPLNQLQLIMLEAKQKNALSPESLQLLNSIIFDTSAKLRKLGKLNSADEERISSSFIGGLSEPNESPFEGDEGIASSSSALPKH